MTGDRQDPVEAAGGVDVLELDDDERIARRRGQVVVGVPCAVLPAAAEAAAPVPAVDRIAAGGDGPRRVVRVHHHRDDDPGRREVDDLLDIFL